ncbi:MAG: hypothetical protein Q9207_004273, partial [Kuettlingeria erythrocarpa]
MSDLELAYRLMASPDPSNPTSSLFAPPSPFPQNPSNRPKILGICRPWFSSASGPVLAACSSALSHYTSFLQHTIVDISLPHLHAGQLAHALTILAEINAGLPSPLPTTLSASNKLLLGVGASVPATDLLLAQKLRNMLMQHLAFLFQQHPGMLIVTPTTPNAGWRRERGDMKYGVSD